MATVLELAREVRHRLSTRETGCLTVQYDHDEVTIPFSDGAIVTGRKDFLACFSRNPVAFHFKPGVRGKPSGTGLGATILVEAIEAIDQKFLVQVWEPYTHWRIVYRNDAALHNTQVKEHLTANAAHLRRLTRLAVSGSIALEAPNRSIVDQIQNIEYAFAAGNWREVLQVEKSANGATIKQAYRKLARRFHPDRWVHSADIKLRDRVEKTFKCVSHAYTQLQHPRLPATPLQIGPMPKPTLRKKLSGLVRTLYR